MPLIGVICGGVNFTDLSITLKEAQVVDGQEQAAVLLNYGNFLQATFDFIIIAFSIFVFIRLISSSIARNKRCRLPQNLRSPARKCNCSRKSATC